MCSLQKLTSSAKYILERAVSPKVLGPKEVLRFAVKWLVQEITNLKVAFWPVGNSRMATQKPRHALLSTPRSLRDLLSAPRSRYNLPPIPRPRYDLMSVRIWLNDIL
jgi:hypothetical protein